jgi:hypothetical protein
MLDVGAEPVGRAFRAGGPDHVTRVLALRGAVVPSDITCTTAKRFASPTTAVSGDPSVETMRWPATVDVASEVEEPHALTREPMKSNDRARRVKAG